MKVAIAHWQGRVSPVFDVAGNVLLVDVADGREQARQSVALDVQQPQARVGLLTGCGTELLICGAISRPLAAALSAAGIEVIAQTCGDVEEVLAAFMDGRLGEGTFLMPGCCGRPNRSRGEFARLSRRCRGRGRWRADEEPTRDP